MLPGLDGAELGYRHLEVRQQLQQECLELLVGAIDLVDQQHRPVAAADGGQQRPLQQKALREDVALHLASGSAPRDLARADGQQLALVVPFVERGRLIEPFVALQADEGRAVDSGERLGHLGLAHAGLALQQQRAAQHLHQLQRDGQLAVGHIADRGQPLGDLIARHHHGRWSRSRPAICPLLSAVQAQPLRHHPVAPVVVRHLDVRRAQEREGIVHGIGERRHAADVGALADALGADRMVRRGRDRVVGLPLAASPPLSA